VRDLFPDEFLRAGGKNIDDGIADGNEAEERGRSGHYFFFLLIFGLRVSISI
jgi:hypothetical protein